MENYMEITSGGGSNGIGVIFSYDISSTTYSKLEDFDRINGGSPEGSLMQASDGKLYGMTYGGGSNGIGVIFSYDPVTSTNTKLLDFDGTNGGYPHYTSFIEISCVITYYRDADGDGYGDAANSIQLCDPQMGYVTNNTDCNDGNSAINPNTKWYKDADNDGYSDGTMLTQCTRPTGYKLTSELKATSGDCNDNKANVNPGAVEICGNGIDDNCDGQIDEGCNGCKVTATVSSGTISCYGGLTTITVKAKGGTAPYQYMLNGGPALIPLLLVQALIQ